jgi:transcription-repair coupling factor (superfamily II helicase)
MGLAQRIIGALKKSPEVVIPGLNRSSKAYTAASLVKNGQCPVIIADNSDEAESLYRDLAFYLGTTDVHAAEHGLLFLGSDEKSPFEAHSPDPRAVMERIATLYRLSRESNHVRALVITPDALSRKHIPPKCFESNFDYLVSGESFNRDHVLNRLINWGYNSVNLVEDPGTFSVRGGIIDIFSPYHALPVRVDLFGDEIESLRFFDPSTQRTKIDCEDAILLPAREIIFSDRSIDTSVEEIQGIAEKNLIPSGRISAAIEDIKNRVHYFGIENILAAFHPEGLVSAQEYLPRSRNTIYIYGDKETLISDWRKSIAQSIEGQAKAEDGKELFLPWDRHLAEGDEVFEQILSDQKVLRFPTHHIQIGGETSAKQLPFKIEKTDAIRAEIIRATRQISEDIDLFKPLTQRLKQWRSQYCTTFLVCHTRGQAERIRSLLEPRNLNVRLTLDRIDFTNFFDEQQGSKRFRDHSIHAWIVLGELSQGFVAPTEKIIFITEEELFGQRVKRHRSRKPKASSFAADLSDLKAGDFVVHIDHGIGLYHGMTKLALGGVDQDFLQIEYRGNDKLYLPVHRLRLVQKYASADEDRKPKLSKLGSTAWTTTKRKAKDTLLKMAAELLRLYSMREALEGFALQPPTNVYTEFEAEFPFEPTVDQQKAFQDVLADLQKPRPMDRLICGDVGYGKTEVAMRAAMIAVLSKKQVAILVPTTVLAAQHYHVFSDRFKNFPVRIGIVSRFQTREEIKRTVQDTKDHKIDIIIGTHRILSKDIQFKDIGLLVIDEEQRFGVAHKERLKKYRSKVHVLVMSATPIPRTMHMSMMGVRDLSVIATPPHDRMAVKTEVHRFSEDVMRDAILKEIRRGGQCFVVHNRVASIASMGTMLKKLVPEARIIIGHGQMAEDELEKVMVRFMAKEFNVLLSTTIIESGIDIPSANTIIINRADRMGLAQLYQLRGRVGRSRVRGYSHFLIPSGTLSKDARKRIAVLQRFTELGAGFKVASHDLDIRGAGNLLGKQQSGTISAIGFETYQYLLKEAIEELQGSARQAFREPEIQLPLVALIPESYLAEPSERLSYYQRFNRTDSDESTFNLLQELGDLHGAPPGEVENLCQFMLLKQRLIRLSISNFDFGPKTKNMPARVLLRFEAEKPGISPGQLVKFVQRMPKSRRLLQDGRVMIYLTPYEDEREILQQSIELVDELLLLRFKAKS